MHSAVTVKDGAAVDWATEGWTLLRSPQTEFWRSQYGEAQYGEAAVAAVGASDSRCGGPVSTYQATAAVKPVGHRVRRSPDKDSEQVSRAAVLRLHSPV